MKDQRIIFKKDNCLHVFRYGKTTNKKIVNENEKIVQSYTFSIDQLNYVIDSIIYNTARSFKEFFSLDHNNCIDCPFSANTSGKVGLCYTHKPNQYKGFISMLKSIAKEINYHTNNIDQYNNNHLVKILLMSNNSYVRFGTYGEPSKHPFELVQEITKVAKNWTGYTHQFTKHTEFAPFFMASVHSEAEAQKAKNDYNYRSFIAHDGKLTINGVQCPASKESGFKSTCALCSLCSGNNGKGKKDVKINVH